MSSEAADSSAIRGHGPLDIGHRALREVGRAEGLTPDLADGGAHLLGCRHHRHDVGGCLAGRLGDRSGAPPGIGRGVGQRARRPVQRRERAVEHGPASRRLRAEPLDPRLLPARSLQPRLRLEGLGCRRPLPSSSACGRSRSLWRSRRSRRDACGGERRPAGHPLPGARWRRSAGERTADRAQQPEGGEEHDPARRRQPDPCGPVHRRRRIGLPRLGVADESITRADSFSEAAESWAYAAWVGSWRVITIRSTSAALRHSWSAASSWARKAGGGIRSPLRWRSVFSAASTRCAPVPVVAILELGIGRDRIRVEGLPPDRSPPSRNPGRRRAA